MASACAKMLTMYPRIFPVIKTTLSKNKLFLLPFSPKVSNEKGFRPALSALLKVMYARRNLIGPDRLRKRSEWDNWDYKSELLAFPKRLNENVSEETLRSVFIHQSYIEEEAKKRQELEMPVLDIDHDLKSNINLAAVGEQNMSSYIKRYLRHCYHALPEEGISALHGHLMSDEVLSHVSFNIGTSDLILCPEYPPSKSTLANTLKAFIGAIFTENTISDAEGFVLDFVCTQLIGKDVLDIWDLNDPLGVLNHILERHNHPLSESRLIFESGRNTLEAIYHVGIYSNKEFLGRGPGETLAIAEEMAAYDALRRIFHINRHELPLPFASKGKELQLLEKENPYLNEWYNEQFKIKATA